MTSGSIGSHRAFMGVCITLCVCLGLVLFVGWRLYFFSVSNRNTLLELAQKAEKKVQDLENMGISFESAQGDALVPSVLPKLLAGTGDEGAKTSPAPPPAPSLSFAP
ncbi:MAG: hypothetical protein B7Z47_03720, partial [Chthoniobacter sp. 12-60-6]